MLALLMATAVDAQITESEQKATCNQPGGTLYTAKVDEASRLTDEEVKDETKLVKDTEPLGHDFGDWEEVTSEDGKTLYKKDANGWWRPAGKPQINRSAVAKANNLRRQRDERIRKNSQGLGFGSNHFLIILVEWSDYKFQDGASSYWPRALGGSNFTDNGSVGSAKEYYTEASYGQFTPNFDVYGPITISRGHLDFPAGDSQEYHYSLAQESMKEALAILDGSIDFSQYDNNHDGYVDNVYMIYPGYAASNGAQNAIWPHASSIYYQTNDNHLNQSLF